MSARDDGHRASTETLVRASREAGVRDERVLSAIREVRREGFVPAPEVGAAYLDGPVPIGYGQVTTQPSLVARMVEGLRLRGRERVLEIGTGLGYQAAILAKLCKEVFTVERIRDLAREARQNLWRAGVVNVTVEEGDGSFGLPGHAPYDAIVLAAAAPRVPEPLVEQLAEGGRLVQPIGTGGSEVVIAFRKRRGELQAVERLTLARFVPLLGAHGLAGAAPEHGAR